MAVKRTHKEVNTSYFFTFTCFKWLPLFEKTDLFDDICKWFDLLKKEENFILGYVIMPDHLHALIKLSSHSRTINRLIAEGKRFRAYEIIKRLKKLKLFHLNYMHNNPVKAGLVMNACDYIHSSAKFYETGEQGIYEVTNYLDYYGIPNG